MNRTEFLKTLPSVTDESTLHPVKRKFLADIRAGKIPLTMHGAFGPETKESDAYVEEIIKPKKGGSFYKLYGCSYLYKGSFDANMVHGIQLGKALLSEITWKLTKLPFVGLGLGMTFLFQRKKFLIFVDRVFSNLEERVIRWYDIPENEYNEFTKEIKRAVKISVQDTLWGRIIWKATRFVCLVLETDNAYRLRIQDALEGAYKWSPHPTIFEVLDVLISREAGKEGKSNYGYMASVEHKWRFIKLALRICLFLSPELNKTIKVILLEIDYSKVKMDEADWYFSLKFLSYDFRGEDINFRMAERARIDKEKDHAYLV